MPHKILVSAGEVSGDLHLAPVIRELQAQRADLQFFGPGGDRMAEAGVELVEHARDLAVMGFSSVPAVLPRLYRLKRQLLKRCAEDDVRLAILTDYQGFNLNLAQALKKLPNPPQVLQYIAPQVWAWRAGRVRKMRGVIDKLAVVFPFEVEIFRAENIDTTFVGHPLIDELSDYIELNSRMHDRADSIVRDSGLRQNDGLSSDNWDSGFRRNDSEMLLALLPGSRKQEVTRHLPVMIDSAERLRKQHPHLQVGIGVARSLGRDYYQPFVRKRDWILLMDDTHKLVADATVAAVCSGTATLETALIGTPLVVVYRTSGLNYHLLKPFIKIDKIALANIVHGGKPIDEIVQGDLTAGNLTRALDGLLSDKGERDLMRAELNKVRHKLERGGAAKGVADLALQMLG